MGDKAEALERFRKQWLEDLRRGADNLHHDHDGHTVAASDPRRERGHGSDDDLDEDEEDLQPPRKKQAPNPLVEALINDFVWI